MDAATCGPLGLSALTVLDTPPPEVVTAAARAGFDAVGLRVFPAGDEPAWPLLGSTPMTREVLARLADTGITLWDIEVLRVRPDKPLEEHLAILDAGHALGARYVLVNVNDPEPARRLERLNVVAAAAGERGLTLAVEPMIFTDVKTVAAARELVAAIDGPAVVLPDSLHLARSGGSASDLAALAPREVPYAQLCDTRAQPAPASEAEALVEARTGRLLPGDGNLPLVDFVRALPDDTVLTVEAPVHDLPLDERCRAALASLRTTVMAAGA